jgi:quercetin dioxygenase-like cupin family protein
MRGKVVRSGERGWEGVEAEGYRPGAATGVARHTIVGGRKETSDSSGPQLEVRYFEVQPGAVSRLEKHAHEHYVIVSKGTGYAILGDSVTEVAPNDVVYVAPLELHQFVNRGDEPFGFFCVVDACRDFSQEPTEEDLVRLAASPAGSVARPFAVPPPQRR